MLWLLPVFSIYRYLTFQRLTMEDGGCQDGGGEGEESTPLVTFRAGGGTKVTPPAEESGGKEVTEGESGGQELRPRGKSVSIRLGRSISTESASGNKLVKNPNRLSRASGGSDCQKVRHLFIPTKKPMMSNTGVPLCLGCPLPAELCCVGPRLCGGAGGGAREGAVVQPPRVPPVLHLHVGGTR